MRVKSPCLFCTERCAGCHSSCEKYINYTKELEDFKTTVRNAKEKDKNISRFREQQVRKALKKSGKRA